MESVRRSRLIKRKNVTDEDVLTVLLVAFTIALVLVLLLCVRVLVSFLKHRNVVLKEKEEEKKETIKRDYSLVTMNPEEEDSFTVDDFTPNEKRKRTKKPRGDGMRRVRNRHRSFYIDETFGA